MNNVQSVIDFFEWVGSHPCLVQAVALVGIYAWSILVSATKKDEQVELLRL